MCSRRFRLLAYSLSVLALLLADAVSAQDRPNVEVVPSIRHSRQITSVALSHEGAYALSAGWDGTVRLWEMATGRLLRTCYGYGGPVWAVAFSPDGAGALSGSSDQKIRLWDLATNKVIRTFEGHTGSVLSVVFSPDGTRVLSDSGDKTVRLWDAPTGQLSRDTPMG